MNYPAVCCNTLLVLVVSLANFSISAETQELLKPIEKSKAEKIIEYNGRDLKAGLYSAKRYRIVEINSDLLFDDKEFSITLFEDRKILVKRRTLHKTSERGYFWKGARVSPEIDAWDPELSPEKLAEMGMNKAEVKDLFFLSFELYIAQWDVDSATGEAHLTNIRAPEVPSQELLIDDVNPAPGITTPHPVVNSFRSVSGTLPPLAGSGKYSISPLPYTPKYHLVYEEDPEKRLFISLDGGADFNAQTQTIEQWRNGQAYAKYLESLPPRENKMVRGEVE